jgi:hypothetical protein
VGGQTGQVLSKLSNGDYVTGWVDTFGPATPTTVGVVYGLTTTAFGGNSSVALGFQAHANIGTGIRNVGIGYQAGLNQNTVSENVVIGHQAAWTIAFPMVAKATGGSAEGVRDFLDSRHGRHFADDVANGIHSGLDLKAAIDAAIARWMGWTINRATSRDHGIPVGLPYLTGFVGLYEILADAE